MRLYFVRHGESEANLLHEFSNRGIKHGLTDRGRQQAQVLAQSLQSVPVAAIFCSPLLRAQQTAEILAIALGAQYQVTDALREFDCGILESESDDASWDQYWQLVEAWLVRQEWDRRIEQGESLSDIRRRFVPFIENVISTHYDTEAIVLVGHGGTYRCMLPLILENVNFQFSAQHGMAHTMPIIAEVRPEGLIGLQWGDVPLSALP